MIAQTCDHSIGISYTSRTNTLHRLTPPMQARVLSRVYGLDRPSPKMFRTRNLYLKLFVTIKSDHFERRINETFIIRLQTPKNKIPATRARVVRQSFSAMWVGIDKILRVPSPFRKKNNKNTKSSQRADGRRDGTRYFFFFYSARALVPPAVTCLASDQSVRGQPNLGEVAFADAPVDGVEPDGVRFALHEGGRPVSVCAVLRLRRPVAGYGGGRDRRGCENTRRHRGRVVNNNRVTIRRDSHYNLFLVCTAPCITIIYDNFVR